MGLKFVRLTQAVNNSEFWLLEGVDILLGCPEDRAGTALSGFLWSTGVKISTTGSPVFSVAAAPGIARPVPWCAQKNPSNFRR